MTVSALEERFAMMLTARGFTGWVREHRWAAEMVGSGPGLRARLQSAGLHDWRFDFAWPSCRLAIEIEGGTWAGGRHTRGGGFSDDCDKYNAATAHGWRVYRVTAGHLKSAAFIGWIMERIGLETVDA